jgi:hypothetical protein
MKQPTPEVGRWGEGEQHGYWQLAYGGYGPVASSAQGIVLSPAPPTDHTNNSDTHSALMLGTQVCGPKLEFIATVELLSQHRTPPNPWESPWLVWGYTGGPFAIGGGLVTSGRFNYLALKPNGWEIGITDPAGVGGQVFLYTGESPTLARKMRVKIRQDRGRVRVWHAVKGAWVPIADKTDERFYQRGSVGLYCEDSTVRFSDILTA